MYPSITICDNCSLELCTKSSPSEHVIPNPYSRFWAQPSSVTLKCLPRAIEQCIKDSDSCDLAIVHLEYTLSVLKERQSALARDLSSYRSFQCRMTFLPVEIIMKIFLFCIPVPSNERGPRSVDRWSIARHVVDSTLSSMAPLNISNVCRRWRAIALAVPELWASVRIGSIDGAKKTHIQRIASAISVFAYRAGALPLSLSLKSCDLDRHMDKPILNAISKHANRISHLDLLLSTSHCSDASGILATTYPRLENMSLDFRMAYGNVGQNLTLPAILFPRVRRLFLDENVIWMLRSNLPDTVRELVIDDVYVDDLQSIIRSTPHIQSLSVSSMVSDRDSEFIISHTGITTLTCSNDSKSRTPNSFYHLECYNLPNLENLIVDQTIDQRSYRFSPIYFHDFFASSPLIHSLEFSKAPVESHNFWDILACIPALRSLKIRQFDESSADVFIRLQDYPLLLPGLQILEVPLGGGKRDTIAGMLLTRARIESVTLTDVHPDFRDEDLFAIRSVSSSVDIFVVRAERNDSLASIDILY